MKIERTVAVAFLTALGYAASAEWSNQKLADRLRQVPDRVDKAKAAGEHEDLYTKLAELTDQQDLKVEGKEPEQVKSSKTDKAIDKHAKKKADAKAKPAKAAKPAKEKKVKVAKPAKEKKVSLQRRVEACLSRTWQTLAEIGKHVDESNPKRVKRALVPFGREKKLEVQVSYRLAA